MPEKRWLVQLMVDRRIGSFRQPEFTTAAFTRTRSAALVRWRALRGR